MKTLEPHVDALRRQCQDQGVAFGDLSKLVKQSLEGQQPQQPREETGRPHPIIRPDLMDSRGESPCHWHRDHMAGRWYFSSWRSSGRTGGRHRGHTGSTGDVNTIPASTRTPLMRNVNTTASTSGVHGNSWNTNIPLPARRDVQATGRQHRYTGSTTNPSVGRRGFVISRPSLKYTDGTRTNVHYNSSRTSTRKRCILSYWDLLDTHIDQPNTEVLQTFSDEDIERIITQSMHSGKVNFLDHN